MEFLKKWMVGLDLTAHDDQIIQYTFDLATVIQPEEIVFIHIKKRIEIPDRFRRQEEYSREDLLKKMETSVAEFDQGPAVKCEVHEGSAEFDLWRETYLHHTDLFIVGEKNKENGRKLVPEKFVRKSFCSVLFVPQKTSTVKKIWVPVDFSDNSRDAIEMALQIKKATSGAEIICHHVFETPSIDLIESAQRDDYVEHFKKEADKRFDDFISNVSEPGSLKLHTNEWLYADVADHIKEEAEDQDADIIIMSSGGKSRFTTLLMGSSTSSLVKLEKRIPLLILKQKINKVTAWDILTNL